MENLFLDKAMSETLEAEGVENLTHAKKISLALEYLVKSSELLDNLKKNAQSELIVKIIEKVASNVS